MKNLETAFVIGRIWWHILANVKKNTVQYWSLSSSRVGKVGIYLCGSLEELIQKAASYQFQICRKHSWGERVPFFLSNSSGIIEIFCKMILQLLHHVFYTGWSLLITILQHILIEGSCDLSCWILCAFYKKLNYLWWSTHSNPTLTTVLSAC